MKVVLLVGGMSQSAEDRQSLRQFAAYVRRLSEGAYTVCTAYLDRLLYAVEPSGFELYDARRGTPIAADCVYIRGRIRALGEQAYYLGRYCAANGTPCVADYSWYYPGTKASQTMLFREHQALFLKTLYAFDNQMLVRRAAQTFGFPFILKSNSGSHGDSNYLVQSQTAAQQILAEDSHTDFLAQAFCANDRDYRLLIMGNASLVFERRGAADTHLNNVSKGAVAAKANGVLPAPIVQKAHDIAADLGLTVAGVDIMPALGTHDFYFLEVNSQPQLTSGALLNEKRAGLKSLLASLL